MRLAIDCEDAGVAVALATVVQQTTQLASLLCSVDAARISNTHTTTALSM